MNTHIQLYTLVLLSPEDIRVNEERGQGHEPPTVQVFMSLQNAKKEAQDFVDEMWTSRVDDGTVVVPQLMWESFQEEGYAARCPLTGEQFWIHTHDMNVEVNSEVYLTSSSESC
jgi:hypothetical protein